MNHPAPDKTQSRAGFSLNEMMIAISILGLLAVLAIPGIGRYLQSWRLDGEANRVASTLRAARSVAVTKGVDTIFVFDAETNEIYYFEDADGNGQLDEGEFKIGTADLAEDVKVHEYTTPRPWVTFGPQGNTTDGGSIVLKNDQEATRTVRVFSGTGNVTVD